MIAPRNKIAGLAPPIAMISLHHCGSNTALVQIARFRSVGVLAGIMLVLVANAPTLLGQQPADLVRGVVARSSAIASGRLTYTFKTHGFNGPRISNLTTFPETTTSFSGSSWAERKKGSHIVRINHDGYFLEFVQTPQRDGSVRPGATLLPQKPLTSRKELNVPPLFAGSFWFESQLRYVEKHADDFRLTDSIVVNSVPVTVVEHAVAAKDHRDAFYILLPALKSGGIMRLYVAASLGFVLPRVEFLTPAGQVAQTYEATDFSEVAPGIYFPRRIWTETHAAGGAARFRAEFTTQCALINDEIPGEDFVVEMPPGTRVQDAREPGNVVTFQLSAASSSAKLTADELNGGTFSRFLDRWQNATILGVVIGTIASISILLAARNQRDRGRPSTSASSTFRQT